MNFCFDRYLTYFIMTTVILSGVIGSHAMAIGFGAITVTALRADAHLCFVRKHSWIMGPYKAYAAIFLASAAGAACRCSLAFAAGVFIRIIS